MFAPFHVSQAHTKTPMTVSLLFLSALFWGFIAFTWSINHFIFKFPGNNYLPFEALLIAMVLGLILSGNYLLLGDESRWFYSSKQLSYYFFVLVTIAVGTNAIQYTPHPPIDRIILSFEKMLGIDLARIVDWTSAHPRFKTLLEHAYNSLTYQLSLLPILAILLRGFDEMREYCVLLLATTLFGFTVYYCCPTLGPASFVESVHFYPEQHATGIKFKEIHEYHSPSTIDGGMVAFPSFHVIWACLCVHLVRHWRVVFLPVLGINLLLISSCILLGWHYVLDVLGSLLIVYFALRMLARYKKAVIA